MRIIHEITAPMQVIVSGEPYRPCPGTTGYQGGRVSITMVTSPRANYPKDALICEPDDTEVIHIEGGIEQVIDAFKQTLSALEATKQSFQESGPIRAVGCPKCREPRASDKQYHASHTWECEAKWSNLARQQLVVSEGLKLGQRRMIAATLRRAEGAHRDCGGQGCDDCKWTGRDARVETGEKRS